MRFHQGTITNGIHIRCNNALNPNIFAKSLKLNTPYAKKIKDKAISYGNKLSPKPPIKQYIAGARATPKSIAI